MIDTKTNGSPAEVAILARLLGNDERPLPSNMARYILELRFSDRDRARMRDLAQRNQEDQLSTEEKDELIAFTKAGSILSILKSKARRTLGIKPKKRTTR